MNRTEHREVSRPVLSTVARQLVYWMPVWVALILLWQIASRGVHPAREEGERLAGEELTVVARHGHAKRSFERMQAEAEAWTDPIYRERIRRLRAGVEREGR